MLTLLPFHAQFALKTLIKHFSFWGASILSFYNQNFTILCVVVSNWRIYETTNASFPCMRTNHPTMQWLSEIELPTVSLNVEDVSTPTTLIN